MEVTEKITVQAEGGKIKRGIFRTLPRMWNRADGKRFLVDYTVKSVTRDGKKEPYTVKTSDSTMTIRTGEKDLILPPGRYEYAITYVVRNHFSRFPEWDELYWNVTGNEWDFPIDNVRFCLLFRDFPDATPYPPPVRTVDLYTGKLDGENIDAAFDEAGNVVTTAPLRRGEGLTVVYTWSRTLMAAAPDPEEYSLSRTLFLPRSNTLVLWLAPLCVAGWFIRAHMKMNPGRMPVVIPLFKAPGGLSPGAFRYIVKKKYDDTAFAADLLNLVAKGGASLGKGPKNPVLKKGGKGRA